MPVVDDKPDEVLSDQPDKETAKPKGPMFLIIIAVIAFVAAIAVFSLTMGVLSSPPANEDKAEKAAESTGEGHGKASKPQDARNELSELGELEEELHQVDDIRRADDMDQLMEMVQDEETRGEEKSLEMSAEDSLQAVKWLEKEKAKLAEERSELEQLKKDFDKQEYRLKQLIAKVNQIESARINALAKLYDGMKANQVAPLLNRLSDEQAVQVMLKMKPANAAKVLGSLSPDRAAGISARMITLSEE